MNKSKFSIWMSVALIAVLLLSSACGGSGSNSNQPEELAKVQGSGSGSGSSRANEVSNDLKRDVANAAKDICECLKKRSAEATIECMSKKMIKYAKWDDNEDFEDAVIRALKKDCKEAAGIYY